MNGLTKAFCRVVMLLDWIPRYGRVYEVLSHDNLGGVQFSKAKWTWFPPRHGLWGFYLLGRIGLLFPYIDSFAEESEDGESIDVWE